MPIGIVSDADFQSELSNVGSAKIEDLKVGRGPKNATPESLRKVISDTAIKSGNGEARELVNLLGGEISQSSVSAYKHGATSTASYHEPDKGLKEHNDNVKEKITKRARLVALAALDEITPEKLERAKLRDISGVAKDMSGIIKDLESPDKDDSQKGVQFNFYMPPKKEESFFEIIDVKE